MFCKLTMITCSYGEQTCKMSFITWKKKTKYKIYHTVGTAPKSKRKLVEMCNMDTIRHNYIAAHLPGLMQTQQCKIAGVKVVKWVQASPLMCLS
jgi:hypothetical protein